MICATHQPQYLPYLGFFEKMKNSDVFIFLDDCQFKKREWHSRNRIRSINGEQWLSVPAVHGYLSPINEVRLDNTQKWSHKHLQSIITAYHQTPFFNDHIDFFKESYQEKWEFLIDLNLHFIMYLKDAFQIKARVVKSSTLGINDKATDRLISLCTSVGADTYLSGAGGKNYMETDKFEKAGISIMYQEFSHPTYKQPYNDFIPFLSSIDFLFNCGTSL